MSGIERLLSQQRPASRSKRPLSRRSDSHRDPRFRNLLVLTGGVVGLTAGLSFLIGFAVTSPASPPDAALEAKVSPPVFLDAPRDPVSLREPVIAPGGAGANLLDRGRDIEYQIRPGETLSEIANSYGLNYRVLSEYNRIKDVHSIRAGTKIVIPSLANENALAKNLKARNLGQEASYSTTKPANPISFSAEKLIDGAATSVHFKILDPPVDKLVDFEWNLGDGQRSYRPEPSYDYIEPRTYKITLTAHDKAGILYRSKPYYVDIPHPQTSADGLQSKFYTLASMNEQLKIEGELVKVRGYDTVDQAPLGIVEQDDTFSTIEFKAGGYYGLTLSTDGGQRYASVFVSPLPTIHSDRDDMNWYKTQYNTGTQSNCGPASIAMAIQFATKKDFPVIGVRQAVGWKGDGSTSFEELLRVLKDQDINASIQRLATVQDMKDVIDRGGIAIVLIHTGSINLTGSRPDKDIFGRYYNDSVGHYIIIKGYTLNGQNFVSYDPIPSDWSGNSMRYADQVSMIGRNRYYDATSIMQGLRRADMIAVYRNSGN